MSTPDNFRAIVIDKLGDEQTSQLREVGIDDLPAGNVLVRVEASTLNYKDGLLLSGAIPLIHSYPMVPGIDLAGTVVESSDPRWKPGARVVANGYGLGEAHWGGLAEYARLDGSWLVACPERFSTAQAMAIGTAGYTAMLCVLALERQGVAPGKGHILVSGASGGVGSVAVSLLSGRGYKVTAMTGRLEERDYLMGLGASAIIDRAEFNEPDRPLQEERWIGAVDTAGSHILANICAQLRYGGAVAATGIAMGTDFPATMYPLALRGITIAGVDSVHAPMPLREMAWRCLAAELDQKHLETISSEITLDEVFDLAPQILAGKIRGRTIVRLDK